MSIMKLLFERKTYAHVHFLPALSPSKLDRKQMASLSQQSIAQALQQPYSPQEKMHGHIASRQQQIQS